MLETNRIYNMDCLEGIKKIEQAALSWWRRIRRTSKGLRTTDKKVRSMIWQSAARFFRTACAGICTHIIRGRRVLYFLRLARICVLLPDICRLSTCAKYDCLGQNERCREFLPKYARTDDLWGCKFADNQTRNERMDGKGVFFRRACFGWRKSTSNTKAAWNYAADYNQ